MEQSYILNNGQNSARLNYDLLHKLICQIL